MRVRRIAVLIDGGYFLKRLPRLVEPRRFDTAHAIAESARYLCKRHVQRLTGLEGNDNADGRWLDHVYRLFFYDAQPYAGKAHHPVLNHPIDFGKSDIAGERRALFAELRRKRKFALRLGHVARDSGWQIKQKLTKDLLKVHDWADVMESVLLEGKPPPSLDARQQSQLRNLFAKWRGIGEDSVRFGLRQKGVDMRIGLDIASMALKQQVDTLILVTGDSDFVPAAKLARREGIEFILDPLWQNVSDELHEHVDGIISVFPRPESTTDATTQSA